jgi:hypothetical protein
VYGDGGAHSDNLVELEGTHLAPIDLGAGPFWVEHCEESDVDKLWEGIGGGGEWRRVEYKNTSEEAEGVEEAGRGLRGRVGGR